MCPKYRPIKDNKNELLQSRLFNHRPKYYDILTYHRHIPYLSTIDYCYGYSSCSFQISIMIRDLIEIRLCDKSFHFYFIHSFIHSFINIHLSILFVTEVCV